METPITNNFTGLQLVQIAWVVKDIHAAETFFKGLLGVSNFSKTAISRARDYDGTYYGQTSEAENLFSIAYSGGTFIELIQPLLGPSVFQDYLDKNPAGGIAAHCILYPAC